MLSSVDTYLKKEIASKVNLFLSDSYIIDEVLGELPKETQDNFKKAFVTPDLNKRVPNEINVSHAFPVSPQELQATIFIRMKEGGEVNDGAGLGNILGTYDQQDEGHYTEDVVVRQSEEDIFEMYIETENPISELIYVDSFTFNPSELNIVGNRAYFNLIPEVVDSTVRVGYSKKTGESAGVTKGFISDETYGIICISSNVDTVRCLDLLVKASLILMRENFIEKSAYQVQKIQFGALTEEFNPDDRNQTSVLFAKESLVSYKVPYGIDMNIMSKLENIKLSGRLNLDGRREK